MLTDNLTIEEIVTVRCREAREDGREEGQSEEKLKIARNLLAEGSTVEFVQKITGLDSETIQGL
jgi:predicted transposase/invertase (TIGR01784 family)